MAEPKAATGRPTAYTPDLAAEIVDRLAEGETLRSICRSDHMPDERTVRRWVIDDREGFAEVYQRARDVGLDAMADELLDIADDGTNDWMERRRDDGSTGETLNHEHVTRSRLRVDTRKWYLSKLAPKRYGDKVALTGGGEGDEPIKQQIEAVVRFVKPGETA